MSGFEDIRDVDELRRLYGQELSDLLGRFEALAGGSTPYGKSFLQLATEAAARGLIGLSGQFLALQVFTAPGAFTYTPNAATKLALMLTVGAGGAGGGVTGSATASYGAAGGGSGSLSIKVATLAQIGTGLAGSIGSGGIAASGAVGGNGGDTSIGALCIGKGGTGGGQTPGNTAGGAGGVAGTGDFTPTGNDGENGSYYLSATISMGAIGGRGGEAFFGGASRGAVAVGAATAGVAGKNYGGGGGGAAVQAVASNVAGGGGGNGGALVFEFGA